MRSTLLAFAIVALWPGAHAQAAFCPCYSSTAATNPFSCGVAEANGTNPSISDWQTSIESACAGPASAAWNGPVIAPIGQGCGSGAKVEAKFPCELFEAIAMQESNWVQFCAPTEPADKVGAAAKTIISKDCGYGVVQVTTGMHAGETPAWDRDRVASEPGYALAVGLSILADKWRATSCVGDNQTAIIEDWYLATWAYNGLSFTNNPNNPNFDAARTVCDPNVTCAARPYQEKVWGWMEHPPSDGRWAPIQPAYPDSSAIPSTAGTKIPNLPEPACESATSCTSGRSTHATRCAGAPSPADLSTVDEADAGTPSMEMPLPQNRGCGCRLGGSDRRVPLSAYVVALIFFAIVLRRRHA